MGKALWNIMLKKLGLGFWVLGLGLNNVGAKYYGFPTLSHGMKFSLEFAKPHDACGFESQSRIATCKSQ